ncbi:MerR family transcriptional regulator [Microbacterium sp. G2-8]|uniref:MerR family transcriptional regulator n=1 Tax=Microbacterium sp. G2-8 TaxID=2842454 RepID=UPI001C8A695C|nr:MerR family transcriptional regulator [Microbacterium sp. G2-8]
MKIGELAARTGAPARMLRYYEAQGLIQPVRLHNGYRDYDDYLVDRVIKIRGLLDAGIPTRIIGEILPCFDKPNSVVPVDPDPRLRETLVRQRERMSENIRVLSENRAAIDRYITSIDDALSARSA